MVTPLNWIRTNVVTSAALGVLALALVGGGTAVAVYGPTPTSPFTLRTLHHPAAARDNAEANYALYLEYEANIHRMGDYLAELGS